MGHFHALVQGAINNQMCALYKFRHQPLLPSAKTPNEAGFTIRVGSTNRRDTNMKKLIATLIAISAAALTATASAQSVYNPVPAGDAQYRQCLAYAAKLYEGGKEPSPIRGQTKEQAWCTCLWNETPDEFNGNLVRFSESTRGQRVNKICEAYSNWHD
jgi:hypothetical protein